MKLPKKPACSLLSCSYFVDILFSLFTTKYSVGVNDTLHNYDVIDHFWIATKMYEFLLCGHYLLTIADSRLLNQRLCQHVALKLLFTLSTSTAMKIFQV